MYRLCLVAALLLSGCITSQDAVVHAPDAQLQAVGETDVQARARAARLLTQQTITRYPRGPVVARPSQ